jgi:hypothetical protein
MLPAVRSIAWLDDGGSFMAVVKISRVSSPNKKSVSNHDKAERNHEGEREKPDAGRLMRLRGKENEWRVQKRHGSKRRNNEPCGRRMANVEDKKYDEQNITEDGGPTDPMRNDNSIRVQSDEKKRNDREPRQRIRAAPLLLFGLPPELESFAPSSG